MAFPPVPFQEWFLRQTSTGNAALNAYVARVKADGGVVEAIGCVPLAVWDWGAPVAPSFVGLLDLFPNAAAAYSLRKLRAAYSGAAVRVRESGGNTEADIGFTSAGELDTVALLAHCGANDGFVTVWYDQSLSNDATQTTAANQPKIVSAGSLVTENGKAAIEFDGLDDMLQKDITPDIAQPLTLFHVRRYRSNGLYCAISYDNSTGNGYADINVFNDFRSYYGSYLGTTTQNTNQGLWYSLANGTSSEVGLDGAAAETGNSGTAGLEVLTIGSAFGSFDAPINSQEIIIYSSDQSANRTGIETNINNFYSIYP